MTMVILKSASQSIWTPLKGTNMLKFLITEVIKSSKKHLYLNNLFHCVKLLVCQQDYIEPILMKRGRIRLDW